MGSKKVAVIDDSVEEIKKEKPLAAKVVKTANQEFETQEVEASEGESIEEVSAGEPVAKGDASLTAPQSESKPKKKSASKEKSEPKKESRSQKFLKVKAMVDPSKIYTLNEAIDLAKQTSYTKFDGTIEAHFNIKSKGFRASLTLPHPVKGQKEKKMLIFLS